jgi:hypothetical protein
MADPNRALLERGILLLEPLLGELVLVGGCATGLLITDAAAGGIRVTNDIDVIVEVATYGEYASLSERLRERGLREDQTEDAPLCRWRLDDIVVDVMPTVESILGFANRWYIPAVRAAETILIAERSVRIVSAVYFVATKLEAFHGRGKDDLASSHDLEDIITLVDGRPELVVEIEKADHEVRNFVASEVGDLLGDRIFLDSLSGFLFPDPASQARRSLIEARLRTLAAMTR